MSGSCCNFPASVSTFQAPLQTRACLHLELQTGQEQEFQLATSCLTLLKVATLPNFRCKCQFLQLSRLHRKGEPAGKERYPWKASTDEVQFFAVSLCNALPMDKSVFGEQSLKKFMHACKCSLSTLHITNQGIKVSMGGSNPKRRQKSYLSQKSQKMSDFFLYLAMWRRMKIVSSGMHSSWILQRRRWM